jgi:hypothetical protein
MSSTIRWQANASKHVQGGLNITGTNCDLFTYNQSRSYLNQLVFLWNLCCAKVVSTAAIFNVKEKQTDCMEQSPSWEENRSSATQEIFQILWNPKVYYRIYKSRPPSLSWARSIQSVPPPCHFSKVHFNIILPSKGSPQCQITEKSVSYNVTIAIHFSAEILIDLQLMFFMCNAFCRVLQCEIFSREQHLLPL